MPKNSVRFGGQTIELNARQADGIKQEMSGLGAEQSIKSIVESKGFKNLPKEIQKNVIDATFGKFREAAINQYCSKNSEIQDEWVNQIRRMQKKMIPTLGE